MIIYCDTREQRPLTFKAEKGLTVVKKTLAVCDYAAQMDDGVRCPVRFERKSIGDLYGTFAADEPYKRFKRQMSRCERMKVGMIIIVEASFLDVASGYEYSKFEGRAMIRKCFTMHIKYPDVIIYPVVFTNSRSESSAWIKSYYESWNKNLKRISADRK